MKAAIGHEGDDGCGTIGCLWVIGVVGIEVYGLVHNWTIREGASWVLLLTFVVGAAVLVLDVAQVGWRKWKTWRGG